MLFSGKSLQVVLPLFVGVSGWIAGCTSVLGTTTEDLNAADSAGDTALALTNNIPIATAGDDQTVASGDLVVLNGNESSDADADQLTFIWQQIDGDVQIDLDGLFGSVAHFDAPQTTAPLQLQFRLIVIDGKSVATDDVTITVTPA